MKKNLIKTLLAIVLSVVCLTGITACGKTSDSQSQDELSGQPYTVSNSTNGGLNNLEYYLKIDNIAGESKDSKHEKWIDVVDFSNASIQSIQTGSPDAAGRGVFEPVVFTHAVDKSTPKIQEACMKGSHIKSADFQVTAPICGKHEVIYELKLEGIKIVGAKVYTVNGEEGTTYLMEEVKMLVNKMTWTVTEIGLDNIPGGKTETSFDQTKKC